MVSIKTRPPHVKHAKSALTERKLSRPKKLTDHFAGTAQAQRFELPRSVAAVFFAQYRPQLDGIAKNLASGQSLTPTQASLLRVLAEDASQQLGLRVGALASKQQFWGSPPENTLATAFYSWLSHRLPLALAAQLPEGRVGEALRSLLQTATRFPSDEWSRQFVALSGELTGEPALAVQSFLHALRSRVINPLETSSHTTTAETEEVVGLTLQAAAVMPEHLPTALVGLHTHSYGDYAPDAIALRKTLSDELRARWPDAYTRATVLGEAVGRFGLTNGSPSVHRGLLSSMLDDIPVDQVDTFARSVGRGAAEQIGAASAGALQADVQASLALLRPH